MIDPDSVNATLARWYKNVYSNREHISKNDMTDESWFTQSWTIFKPLYIYYMDNHETSQLDIVLYIQNVYRKMQIWEDLIHVKQDMVEEVFSLVVIILDLWQVLDKYGPMVYTDLSEDLALSWENLTVFIIRYIDVLSVRKYAIVS